MMAGIFWAVGCGLWAISYEPSANMAAPSAHQVTSRPLAASLVNLGTQDSGLITSYLVPHHTTFNPHSMEPSSLCFSFPRSRHGHFVFLPGRGVL